MEKLHTDILENILWRLLIEPALHAKRVCTTWRAILRSKTEKSGFLFSHGVVDQATNNNYREQLFYEDEYDHSKMNVNNYYSDSNCITQTEHGRLITEAAPKNVMVGSCNGLVFFGKYNLHALDPFLICNPFTGESVFLPEFNYSEVPGDNKPSLPRFGYGRLETEFGYCPSTNHYKVITIYYLQEEHKGHAQVYTVGGEWRYIGFIDRDKRCTFSFSSGIYANGEIYWLQRSGRKVQEGEIVAFDLEHEEFHYIPLPCSENLQYTCPISPLKLLGGNNNLYLVHTSHTTPRADIWGYKRSSSCWIKEFSMLLEKPYFSKPLAITRSKEFSMWDKHSGHGLYCYDPKTSTLNKLWDDKAMRMRSMYIDAIPHIRSTVSLKVLGETNVTSLKDLRKLRETNLSLKKATKPKSGGAKKILGKFYLFKWCSRLKLLSGSRLNQIS
ncbi:putative F-box protein At1g71320 [Papaver somniferum]|uniref:putative F-box protein At1g71320 n=1 Tax=Papaver somniferum TaxID=3469 RepID=UPI000E6F5B71|nr:putative F-box protein At1g71320 [Papaver somniferum]